MAWRKTTDGASPMDALLRKSLPTVVAADVHFLGNIVSEGALDIDGKVEGNVKCKSLTLRRNGRIQGDAYAIEAHVYGELQGMIRAKEVHLYASCRVEGIIVHEKLTIEDGAYVDGQFKRADRVLDAGVATDGASELEVFRHLKLIGS